MKVNIWIHKNDVIKGLISDYYLTRPYHDRHDNFVQVTISVDEFNPERYGFSEGGIANKDMVRFLFDDNVRN